MSIPYFREIKDKKTGFVYSLDNLVMKFRLYWAHDDGAVDEVFNELSKCCHVCDSFTSFKFATYKHQFIFHMPDENTFWVGVGFNGSGGVDYSNCSVDFNPNKVGQYDSFADIHNKLLEMSKEVELKRYDLAVDIPVSRENFIGFKDKRIYEEYRRRLASKSDSTEYWGKRSSAGFVKLYNKQLECGLDVPMTRLELTLDLETSAVSKLPNIIYIDDNQMQIGESAPTGTDLVLALSCCEHSEFLNYLPRRNKEKTKSVLKNFATSLEINPDICDKIRFQADSYTRKATTDKKHINVIDDRRNYVNLLKRELNLPLNEIEV